MGRRVQLVMIRHSKSCSNHIRAIAGTHDPAHPLVKIAKNIRDPVLSEHGQAMAISYGPVLRRRLADLGINLQAARVASSGLARAHQTAELLFPDRRPIDTVPHVKEFGDIPENTPARRRRCRPDWRAFLRHIAADTAHDQFVVVAHGSYLREVAWPAVSGQKHRSRLDNLDGFFAEGEITPTGCFKRIRFVSLPRAPTQLPRSDDKCSVAIERKIAPYRKMTRYSRRHGQKKQSRRSRSRKQKQRGGATAMPLTYYAPGSYETRTTDATGVGLAGTAGNWARAPLLRQEGGSHRRQTRKHQKGGFTPSVMGAFATNGLRLMPVAGYMGYKLWNGSTQQKTRRRK
jgi:broad specificity phosphatase PhoE